MHGGSCTGCPRGRGKREAGDGWKGFPSPWGRGGGMRSGVEALAHLEAVRPQRKNCVARDFAGIPVPTGIARNQHG